MLHPGGKPLADQEIWSYWLLATALGGVGLALRSRAQSPRHHFRSAPGFNISPIRGEEAIAQHVVKSSIHPFTLMEHAL